MPFELPDNLHPSCGPVAWLLGTWRGNGHGDYPTIEKFQFGQELIFTHDGRPFFHYMSRSWILDEDGEHVRDAAMESGFLRCPEPGKVEFLLSHNTGFAEVWYGAADAGKVEMHTAGVSFTETAKEVTAGSRMYCNVEGDLLYAYDMAAMGQELQPHTWARLQRA
jgi:hypothetical protein